MKTIIMAGGRGTRISAVASDIPKPMIEIDGKPVLEREIECLRAQGFIDITLTISHMTDRIMEYFRDEERFEVHIEYFLEEQPLGNAGALFRMRDTLREPFLLLNTDAVFDIDFNRFANHYRKKGGLVTLFSHPNSHSYDSGVLTADGNGAVTAWMTKEDIRPQWYRNRVNAGLHVIDPMALDMSGVNADAVRKEIEGKRVKVDLDRQVLKPLCDIGLMFCYDSQEYVRDMGTPDRYKEVCDDYAAGRVQARNLRNKQKAVFVDWDGTINRYVGFLRDIDEFELLLGVAEAVKKINASGYLVIVVTDQPVIARGRSERYTASECTQ